MNKKYPTTTYRKRVYQIRKYLLFIGEQWANIIRLPSEPYYLPKHITIKELKSTLEFFKFNRYFKQLKALIFLGSISGMRAEELYQLTIEDIDIDNRIVHINHNPSNGQSTKTKVSRISFFTSETLNA